MQLRSNTITEETNRSIEKSIVSMNQMLVDGSYNALSQLNLMQTLILIFQERVTNTGNASLDSTIQEATYVAVKTQLEERLKLQVQRLQRQLQSVNTVWLPFGDNTSGASNSGVTSATGEFGGHSCNSTGCIDEVS